jgi:tetratricopeptide (TPR) repeat protein
MDNTQDTSKNVFARVAFIVLLITILFTPIAFIPSRFVPLELTKTFIVTVGTLLSSLILLIVSFKDKRITFPRHPVPILSALIVGSIAISTLLSASISKSIFGQGFELGSASFLLSLFLIACVTLHLTYKSRERLLYVYSAILVSFVVLASFHILRIIIGSEVLSLGILQNTASTVLGKWTDLGVFASLITILSYISFRFLKISKKYKNLPHLFIVISIFIVALVNSQVVWGVSALIFLLIVVYEYYVASNTLETKSFLHRIPITASILAIIFILGFMGRNVVINPLLTKLKIEPVEVSLPWQLTLHIGSKTIIESPLFGAGPNRFINQYLKFKPVADVNPSIFWNAEFNNGFGLIPTFVITQGMVGLVLWILFIVFFASTGYKALKTNKNLQSKYFIISSFFSSMFLWLISIVYVPSHSILLLTFVLSGVFIASIISEEEINFVVLGKNPNSRLDKIIQILIIVMIILFATWLVFFVKKIVAIGYFESGVKALSLSENSGILKAESSFKRALAIDKTDTYYQALSEVNIAKVSDLARKIQEKSRKDNLEPTKEELQKVGKMVDEAVGYSRSAINIDPTNYYNYLAEARISETALSLNVANAYENAKRAYVSALDYNPYNPSIYLSLARLEVTQNKLPEALKYVGAALQLKQNYIDAIFLLSQIQVNQGQIKDAIISVQYATNITPDNPLLYFQLGLLHYNDKNYKSAADSFTSALKLDNKYANAQYFLGLSYARLNNVADAIKQFESLVLNNPENEEVALILSNLRKGKTPFNDAPAQIDNKPEKRNTLPVKEKTTIKSTAN